MKKLEKKQNEVRKIIRQLALREGSIARLCGVINITHPVLYNFQNHISNKLSESTAEKIYTYCLKHRIKIRMSDLRPHILYLSKLK